jgi:branched-chain amino acid transport system substrate-binding protein
VTRRALGALLAASLVAAASACSRDSSSVQPPTTQPEGPQTIRVGALLPETGPDAATGVAARWLLETRLAELNVTYGDHEPGYSFELEVVDTESDPAIAREVIEELADDSVKIVVGPFSDAEVKAVADIADRRGILVASPGSSAISLAQVDNVLRLVPDDRVQASAIVDLARRDGVTTVAEIGRRDPTNADLLRAVGEELEALGGGRTEPVLYAPDATNYESSVQSLTESVTSAFEILGPGRERSVGIVAAGDDEMPQVLTLAAASAAVGEVPWFGSSGLARSDAIVTNPSAAAFAAAVGLASTTFGLDPATEERWGPLVQLGKEQTGVEPDAVAFAAYDALDVLVGAVVASSLELTDATNAEIRDLRTVALGQSLVLDGVTGPLKLNEFGDRTTGVFDYWSVCDGPTGYEWRRTGVWSPGPDGLTGGTITGTATC